MDFYSIYSTPSPLGSTSPLILPFNKQYKAPLSPIFKKPLNDIPKHNPTCLTPNICSTHQLMPCPYSTSSGKCKTLKCICMENSKVCELCKLNYINKL